MAKETTIATFLRDPQGAERLITVLRESGAIDTWLKTGTRGPILRSVLETFYGSPTDMEYRGLKAKGSAEKILKDIQKRVKPAVFGSSRLERAKIRKIEAEAGSAKERRTQAGIKTVKERATLPEPPTPPSPETGKVHEIYRARAESPRFLRISGDEQEKVFKIIETTHPAGPEAGRAATSTIQALNTAKITGSQEAGAILAKRAGITEPALIDLVQRKALEEGAVQPGRIPPKALRAEVAAIKRLGSELEQATKLLATEGMKTTVAEGGVISQVTGTTRMFGGGKVQEATEIVAKAMKDPEAALILSKEGRFLPKITAAAKEAGGVIGKGALRKGGLYGGIAALLAMLMMKGKKEPEMSPAQQIQMAQQMGEVQQQQALTQSLVGSRGAAAQKNLAQADLLRLQAMMAMGGGQRGLL